MVYVSKCVVIISFKCVVFLIIVIKDVMTNLLIWYIYKIYKMFLSGFICKNQKLENEKLSLHQNTFCIKFICSFF